MGRRGRRCKQLPDDVKGTRGYWELKEEPLDHTLWELAFEEAMDLLQDRQRNEWHILNMWVH